MPRGESWEFAHTPTLTHLAAAMANSLRERGIVREGECRGTENP